MEVSEVVKAIDLQLQPFAAMVSVSIGKILLHTEINTDSRFQVDEGHVPHTGEEGSFVARLYRRRQKGLTVN